MGDYRVLASRRDAHRPSAPAGRAAAPLRPPRHRARARLPDVPVWAVQVLEEAPPAGAEPVEWLLLTTTAVPDVTTATTCVARYGGRWGMEVWQKILKSGCRIAARQLGSAAGLARCLTLSSVIAWRILYATMLGRALPDVPCTVLLALEEWQALYCAIHRTPTPPETPPSLRQALRWIAQLGGFLAHRKAGEPGVTVLWRGWQHLIDLTIMYRIMRSPPSDA